MTTENGFALFWDRGVLKVRMWKSDGLGACGKIMPYKGNWYA